MSFWDTIVEYADKAWDWGGDLVGEGADWLVGVEQFTDEGGDYSIGYEGGVMGFLDSAFDYSTGSSTILDAAGNIIGSGARAYLQSQKGGGPFQTPQIKAPKITRSASTVNVAGLSSLNNPIGVNNPDVRAAMQRLSQRTNVNPQMQSISQQYMTKRQGAKTMGLESSSLARVRTAPAASVRTESKQEVV